MIRFLDGPAVGVVLSLRRAPLFLRVVEENGKFDALDQLTDEPKASEKIHVYRRHGPASGAFVCSRGKNRHLSGFQAIAEYRHFPVEESTLESIRSTSGWRAWATLAHESEKASDPKS